MKQHGCDPERQNTLSCPVFANGRACFTDLHHTEYPRRDYRTRIEKEHRALDANKIDVCRAVHNAIHSSGHIPDMPSRDEMLLDISGDVASLRSRIELYFQLELGEKMLAIDRPCGDVA